MCFIKSQRHGKCTAMAVGPVCEEFTDCDIYDRHTQYSQLQVLVLALH